jgi:hypothetical protein
MVSMPYAAVAFVGFLIYRGCKKNAQFLETMSPPPTRPEGDSDDRFA